MYIINTIPHALVVFVSEILLVCCAHSFDFWYVNNSCINTICQHFPWSILYMLHNHYSCFASWWFKEQGVIITHTLYLRKINLFVCALQQTTDKFWATWLSIWGDLHSSQVKHTPQDSINEYIFWKLNPLVVVHCRFEIHLCIVACVMSHGFTHEAVLKSLPAEFP